ncbi:sensor histidine kinase [Parvularcula maris]|uniref:histidine kinase n=1 Tax=Parvularcula maris TaxID=2965077 RepID=A0A9X2L6L8_9PROT|nr:sensor histidine kinase [Parvularcula maris]MCQ8184084.1 sensor histidine kinase [Parvularcula maris]
MFLWRALGLIIGTGVLLLPYSAYAAATELAVLRELPCYPGEALRDAEGNLIKTPKQACLEALETARPEDQPLLLDAAMSGLKVIASNGFQDLDLSKLTGAAVLKGEVIRLGEHSVAPNEDNLRRAEDLLRRAALAEDAISEAYALRIYSEMLSRLGRVDEVDAIIAKLSELPISDRPHVRQVIIARTRFVERARGNTVASIGAAEELRELYLENGEPLLASLVNYDIANVLLDLGDYEAGLQRMLTVRQALEDAERSKSVNYGIVRIAIGGVLTKLERHQEALVEFDTATKVLDQAGAKQVVPVMYKDYSRSLFATGKEETALDLAFEAGQLTAEENDPFATAELLVWAATKEVERGNEGRAEAALERAAELTGITPETDLRSVFDGTDRYYAVAYARSMAHLLGATGQSEEGLRYARYALDMHADWLDAEKLKVSVDAQTLFEMKNQEQAIDLLRSEQALQKAENELNSAKLERQRVYTWAAMAGGAGLLLIAGLAAYGWRSSRRIANFRAVLIAEEHHRTKNALQMAASLVRAEAPKRLRYRLSTLGLVYDHLHQTNERCELEAAPFLEELLTMLSTALAPDNVTTELQCEPLTIRSRLASPIGLLVCEMVINAFKHAFPEGEGTVKVTLAAENSQLALTVRDDGIGKPVEPNSEEETGRTGKGQQLIQDLADQLRATATVIQNEAGTTWRVASIAS